MTGGAGGGGAACGGDGATGVAGGGAACCAGGDDGYGAGGGGGPGIPGGACGGGGGAAGGDPTGCIPWVEARSSPTEATASIDAGAPMGSPSPPREIGAVTIPPGISNLLPQFLHVARAPCGGIFFEEIR